ncbi:2Fe-2S iron-sulfur cluster binding domain-containing protein [Actimicrobium sp. CCI2.3]|uniref:2Fe-2S iron-sulfur cluster-binding protein n=1 Tax=Actimicrobium sp. CCI2.3 TaxID=3048616 RepID=UPI002AB3EA7E|nr:2Fe-2S iron-sulfur cluster binding domain-containing protein [Actimicrobium sp. CCI2.3]MDY7573989.1 2Fe-2S iron-sulfur cluster binding domain-containing protein [Actimicrobium sp. CCI2.3]MEB0021903.1 2Fe-2S iron-sulfur cluster binding domain-containing protein [Actimicrobium sp. CCI2.3]
MASNVFSAQITGKDWRFDVPDGDTLMAAARSAGITLPSSCRNGTCRTCLCRLSSGTVRYTVDWPGLSADEKKDGTILPCVAVPLSDVVIDQPLASRP